MPKPKLNFKEILFPALSLFVICLAFAGALAGVNAVTKAPIEASEAKAADAAREEIFPGARFVDNGGYYAAMDQNGTPLGYCIDGQAQGYGGLIQVTVGLDMHGAVMKVQVISCEGETPGLGTKIKEESFLKQFLGQKDAVKADSIASATYSSQGVENAVNMALEIYREQIWGGEAG